MEERADIKFLALHAKELGDEEFCYPKRFLRSFFR